MNFNIFAATSFLLFSSSPFASMVNAQSPNELCKGKRHAETEIDLFNSIVTESTLHLPGGRLVYEDVGIVRDKPVNLVVTIYDGDYTTSKPEKNGKGKDANGVAGEGMFGNINLQTKENDIQSGEGNFEFCFRDKETDELVTVDSFMWSVYDLDERSSVNNGIKEKFIIDTKQAEDYVLWPNAEESEVKLFCENFHLWPYKSASQFNQLPCNEGERIVFHSSTQGTSSDNPQDKDDMTDLQKKRSVQFTFANKSCWRFTYNHYCPPDEAGDNKKCTWYGGGNFLFAGSAKQLIEEGECITDSPTQSPSKLPTQVPTMSPSKSPTVSPTAAPTKNPTAAPTKSPTVSPTAAPTTEPTASPTQSPSAGPTNDPTAAPTAAPTLSPTVKITMPPINTNGGNDDDDLFFEPTCPEDVELVAQKGTTDIDLDRVVKIVSQDTSTVRVALNQGWDRLGDNDIPIDSIYYSFRTDMFDEKCYEETSVMEGTVFDTITIQCQVTRPFAKLEICVVDDLKNELLTIEDDATVPQCCHPTDAPEKPTVCYSIKINCETECVEDNHDKSEVRRGLRGSR